MERRGGGMLGQLATSGFDVRALSNGRPVIRTPLASIVVGFDEASRVLRDPAHFSSDWGALAGGMGAGAAQGAMLPGGAMLSVDPPDHTRLRGVVSKAFTPRSIALLEPRIRELASALLAGAGQEPYDLVDGLAYPLPVIVIAELLGVPAEDRALFKRWSDDLVSFDASSLEGDRRGRAVESVEALRDYFLDVIERRRREPAGDDLVTRLVRANQDGVVSMDELVTQCILLLVAGNETTTHLIGNAVNVIARHPAQRELLEADASLIPNAVEEVLRFDGVVPATVRRAAGGATLDGEPVADGSAVLVLVTAANRDPDQFTDPDEFDVTRHNAASNLGFGAGIHFCLGARLARLETQVALETLFSEHPNWRLAEPEAEVEYTLPLRGPKSLGLRL
jgi:hypothetical protein